MLPCFSCQTKGVRHPDPFCLSTSLSLSFSRKWRATWLGRMFRSMFSLCSRSSLISFISSFACTRHRKSRRAVYSSWETERIKLVRTKKHHKIHWINTNKQKHRTADQCCSPVQLFYKAFIRLSQSLAEKDCHILRLYRSERSSISAQIHTYRLIY